MAASELASDYIFLSETLLVAQVSIGATAIGKAEASDKSIRFVSKIKTLEVFQRSSPGKLRKYIRTFETLIC
ncbi:hypothetical protein EZ449_19815 [Pedobacter frigidisoli]|uniref:Uncharacterized protein n=1 Tax=Pedobacter frigidisoli TaxID=2530455 RepID=A0A4R0NKQ5_9SPHI|nr:hypothetical protein [Pedobacter frigidisoli]TCD00749.1 hypothetical protein EZ449_19815 [Pedobacter frigidisoli]